MAEIKRGTACSWGSGIATSASFGRVQSWNRTSQSASTEIVDQDGDVVTKVYHGFNSTAEAEIVPTGASYTVPTVGNLITVTDTNGTNASASWKIETVGDTQTSGDYVKLRLSLSLHPDITS
jgi:hypothetical protein